jgi:hypothetical protein
MAKAERGETSFSHKYFAKHGIGEGINQNTNWSENRRNIKIVMNLIFIDFI